VRGALTTGPRLRRRPERQRTGRAAAAAVPCRRVAGLRRWRDQSKEGIFIPKYLIQASHSNEGFEGVGTKGGSGRRDAVAETCPTTRPRRPPRSPSTRPEGRPPQRPFCLPRSRSTMLRGVRSTLSTTAHPGP